MKVLFVCLGNICRSPAAEAIFHKMVNDLGIEENFTYESAATSSHHSGEKPDTRMGIALEERGYKTISLSRQVSRDDLEDFDIIFAMDNSNLRNLNSIASEDQKQKIMLMSSFANNQKTEVPDPYYGGEEGFTTLSIF